MAIPTRRGDVHAYGSHTRTRISCAHPHAYIRTAALFAIAPVPGLSPFAMMLKQFGFGRPTSSRASASQSLSLDSAVLVSSPLLVCALPAKRRRYNSKWGENREWLEYREEVELMFSSWCLKHNKNNQKIKFVRGCSSMKIESIKKHELSHQHLGAKVAQCAQSHPDCAPMEICKTCSKMSWTK